MPSMLADDLLAVRVAGSTFLLKISGLGTDRGHDLVRSSCVEVTVVVVRTAPKFAGKTLRLQVSEKLPATTTGELSLRLARNSDEELKDVESIRLRVEPRLIFPAIGTEAGLFARVLLAESPSPDSSLYASRIEL